ncbi:beta-Ig-H3/fasciclin [Candidatus Poribacteria bacterium]|nr:beta-Ig-H3/fasciclin [Candidatus Poribacteria bacterium]
MKSIKSITRRIMVAVLGTLLLSLVNSPSNSQPQDQHEVDIISIATKDPQFSTLAQALEIAGLVETLKTEGPFTVFAPNDKAFQKLPEGTLDGLLQDTSKLKEVLLYHVITSKVLAADVVNLKEAKAANDKTIDIEVKEGNVILNSTSKVIATDILAKNGAIHIIDTVLMPPEEANETIVGVAKNAGIFTSLLDSAAKAGLVETLESDEPLTLLAPTDEAFSKLPAATLDSLLKDIPRLKNLLLYHVLEGQIPSSEVIKLDEAEPMNQQNLYISLKGDDVFINEAKVTQTDIKAKNGIIHIIDTVLVPSAPTSVELVKKLPTYWGLIKNVQ